MNRPAGTIPAGRLRCPGVVRPGQPTNTPPMRADPPKGARSWKVPGSDKNYEKRGLHDTWGNPLQPRNLTLGQYRGGRRPVDVFRRIYAGIKGTPMPGFGRTALKDEEIWDVVNYVMSLQYETTPKKPTAEHVAVSK